MNGSSQTRSSKISPTHSRSSRTVLVLLTLSAAFSLPAAAADLPDTLPSVSTRDQKVVHRWSLPGDPRGLALGSDGTIYVGLAQPQAVIAVDPKSGAIRKKLVLDSADIASTKELVTLRVNRDGTRLYIANGSDESATILSIPELHVVREITTEGETIRDAVPDPGGRYLYLLGRRVHVYDADGERELHTLPFDDPMAIAASSGGETLAVIGPETFGSTKATVVALYDTATFKETARDPLQTDKPVEAALFAAGDRALIALGREWLYEKPLTATRSKTVTSSNGTNGPMRMTIDFGDLVNSQRICLPDGSGPQIAALAASDLLLFAEQRCASSGAFSGSNRRVTPASLYGVSAYALAYERESHTLLATDRAGYLTIYRVPRAPVVR